MSYIECFGAIPSPKDVRDYQGVCAVTSEAFPSDFELEMPSVKNQGAVGSCVAQSLSLIIEYFNKLQENSTATISPGFIYGNRSETDYTGVGLVVSQALNRVKKCGSVTTKKFNKHVEVPEMIELVKAEIMELLPDAYPNRITFYYKLTSDDAIKAALMQNGPVIFAMNWFTDIKVVNGVLTTECGESKGSHAMVIYGWNEQGWKIQNSWGTDWGINGRAILPYDVPRFDTWGIADTCSDSLKQKKINELTITVSELKRTVKEYEQELENLQQSLIDNINSLELKDTEYQSILQKYNALEKDYTLKIEKLQECEDQIELLNEELLKVKKPFNSTVGTIIATIVNFLINIVSKRIK